MTTEELIRQVKESGQSIIDNAESVVGDYKYQTSIDITVRIRMGDTPKISVDTEFLPEKTIDENCIVVRKDYD